MFLRHPITLEGTPMFVLRLETSEFMFAPALVVTGHTALLAGFIPECLSISEIHSGQLPTTSFTILKDLCGDNTQCGTPGFSMLLSYCHP